MPELTGTIVLDGKTVLTNVSPNEIDQFIESSLPRREIEPMRPVLVYEFEINGIRSGGGGRFAEAARSLGFDGAQTCLCTIIKSDTTRFVYPRNFKWRDLPVVTAPEREFFSHRLKALKSDGAWDPRRIEFDGLKGSGRTTDLKAIGDNVRAVVISSHEFREDLLDCALSAWRDAADEALPVVMHHDGKAGRIIPHSQVRDIKGDAEAEHRFVFNHTVNLNVLARHILLKFAVDERLPRSEANACLPQFSNYSIPWGHPLVLQTMHLLRSMGRTGTKAEAYALSAVDSYEIAWTLAEGMPIFDKVDDGYRMTWTGTGSYPAWREPMGEVENLIQQPKDDSPMIRSYHWALTAFKDMVPLGLLGLKDDGSIVLSPRGVALLDVLGPETKDPDVLLRWRRGGSRIGGAADVKAMDRWLNRAFRSVKRRVAALPDIDALDEGASVAPGGGTSNRLAVFGASIPLSVFDKEDAAVAAAVAELLSSNDPITSKRCGLGFTSPHMGVSPQPSHVWFGVPLRVLGDFDCQIEQPGFLKDASGLAEAALQSFSQAPEPFRTYLAGATPAVVYDLRVSERTQTIVELPSTLSADTDDVVVDIVMGVTSRHDVNGDIPDYMKTHLRMFSDRPPLPMTRSRTDGINQYRCDDGIHVVTYGHIVGKLNETKGTHVMDLNVSDERRAGIDRMRKHLLVNAHQFFSRDLSDHGCWAILSNGSPKRMDV
jgi:hypothetical protein